jgi:hypothetical protein
MPGRRNPPRDLAAHPGLGRKSFLIDLPQGLSDRATEALERGETGVETMNSLIAEALSQYLERLEAASKLPGGERNLTAAEIPHRAYSSRPQSGGGEVTSFQMSTRAKPLTGPQLAPSREDRTELEMRPATRRVRREQEDDLLGIDEVTHAGARKVFEQTIEDFDQSREKLEALWVGGIFDESAYPEVRDEVLEIGTIVPESIYRNPAPSEEALDSPHDRPLFGLHNRDYPSLWGLMLLARAAAREPVPWSEFASGLEMTARACGGPLRIMDEVERPKRGLRYSASFPDPWKETRGGQWISGEKGRKTARLYPFVKNTFARIQKGREDLRTAARGPLPRWNAIQFLERDGLLFVEPTLKGYELLNLMEGVSLQLPHPAESARSFLNYIIKESPGDAEAFLRVLRAIQVTGERAEVVEANLDYFDQFLSRKNDGEMLRFAGNMTQGYVARGREWGLIEADMAAPEDGKKTYVLTDAGTQAIEQLTASRGSAES